ncbi:MAG: hypothetical protein JSS75_11220 [Bacteroidetes bacterium]|nr:hypothetical protein [Bacteroidota bacterium]
MKYTVLVVSLLFATLATAQTRQTTLIPELGRTEDESYQRAREAWMRQMHRAEPGLNIDAIDAAMRETKFEQLFERRSQLGMRPLATTLDTFAGGRLVGAWSERGSNNVCGRTHTADIDFDTDSIYVASSMGNIWRAKRGDSVWMILNDDHRFGDIRMLRILHTSTGKRIIAACNGPVTVRYSDDGGKTWQSATGLDGPKSWGGIKRATVSANEDTICLVGNEWDYSANWRAVSFLYRSTDQGATFKKIGNWPVSSDQIDVWQSRDTTSRAFFIKQDSLFYIANDSTLAFVNQFTNDTIGKAGGVLLDGAVIGGKPMIGICAITNNTCQIYASNGNFKTWSYKGYVDGGAFSANSFRVSTSLPFKCYLGNVNVNVPSDTSAKFDVPHQWWEYYGDVAGQLHADIDGIDVIRDPVGNELTLFSTDGGTFISHDRMESVSNLTLSGIRTSQYYSTYTSVPPYVINAGAQDQGWQRGNDSKLGILNMNQVISGDYGHIVSSDSGTSVWGDYPGFVIRYFDARTSGGHRDWSFIGSNKLWIPPLCAIPGKSTHCLVACGDSTSGSNASMLWRLVDNGTVLQPTMLPYDFSIGGSTQISAIAISPLDTMRWYVLTNNGYYFNSTNAGKTWSKSDTNSLPGGHYFYGSTIIPSRFDKNTLWVAGSGYSNPGAFVSNDNGKTWTAIDSALPKTLIYGMVASNDERYLFAATEIGPYLYSTAAKRWYDLAAIYGQTAPDMLFWSVERVPHSNTIRFGTYGRGIWDIAVDSVGAASSGVISQAEHISSLQLNAVPSITSSVTQLRFSLGDQTTGSLRIYDLTGRVVRHIPLSAPSGEGAVAWDATTDAGAEVPSGFYTAIVSTQHSTGFTKIEVVR